jgi:hypothetical protein
MGKEGFCAHLPDNLLSALPLILLLMQRLPSNCSNPAISHLISPIDLSFKIGTLLFFEEDLLIIG